MPPAKASANGSTAVARLTAKYPTNVPTTSTTPVREAYKSVLGKLDFGVVAAVDTRDDRANGIDVLADVGKYVAVDMAKAQYDYFEIKVNNVAENNADTALFFCCYVQYGGATYYIHNGVMANTVNSVTYNEIAASEQA